MIPSGVPSRVIVGLNVVLTRPINEVATLVATKRPAIYRAIAYKPMCQGLVERTMTNVGATGNGRKVGAVARQLWNINHGNKEHEQH